MKSYLPFEVKYSPIKKLAIIPFEKKPDAIYRGLELQFIDGAPYGTGYRVIAYRNDNFVDVYDDNALNFLEDEEFCVTENGLHKHVQTEIHHVQFCKTDDKQKIAFEFMDIQDRLVKVAIEENINRKSIPMNLLAPIGLGSKKPNYLPVFFLYEFDFIRKGKTLVSLSIGGKKIRIDKFPVPMNGQKRLYARYSNECEILEFANTDALKMKEIELSKENVYRNGNVDYIFERENVLQRIEVHAGENVVQICWEPGFDLQKMCGGVFTINPRPQMGYLQGEYQIQQVQTGTETIVEMIPKAGWISKPNTLLAKIILGKKSVFCSWSKKYKYELIINWVTKEVKAQWKNGNLKEKKVTGKEPGKWKVSLFMEPNTEQQRIMQKNCLK